MKRAAALKYISKSKLAIKYSYISAYKSWNSVKTTTSMTIMMMMMMMMMTTMMVMIMMMIIIIQFLVY